MKICEIFKQIRVKSKCKNEIRGSNTRKES